MKIIKTTLLITILSLSVSSCGKKSKVANPTPKAVFSCNETTNALLSEIKPGQKLHRQKDETRELFKIDEAVRTGHRLNYKYSYTFSQFNEDTLTSCYYYAFTLNNRGRFISVSNEEKTSK